MNRLRSSVSVLSGDEIERIHVASLRILERTGVKMPERECLAACAEAGAEVDAGAQIVRIPARVMDDALCRMRREVHSDEVPSDEPARLSGRISTQIYVVDHRANSRRLGVTDDILKGIALVRKLKNIPTCNAVVVPSDVPAQLSDVVSFQMIYTYSEKPGGTYVLTPFSARHILAMAAEMGREAPFLLDTVSPLQFQANSLEIAVLFARAKQPVTISPMVMAGGTGPVTLAGTLALANAEALASLFLIYALSGGMPAYTSIPHSLDLRTTLCSFGSANQALLGVAVAQLARHYGFIPECNAGLTDSPVPDFQAGCEKTLTATFAALAGVREVGAQGIAGSDQGFSFEQLVLDNEWLEAYNYVLGGLEVSAETLAEDVISAVGIGGSFLGHEHTAAHMRTSYPYSKLPARDAWETWQARGAKDALARAGEFVEQATAGYREQRPVCMPAQQHALEEIVAEACREAGVPVVRLQPAT